MARLYGEKSEYLLEEKLKNKYIALFIISYAFATIILCLFLFIFNGGTWKALLQIILPSQLIIFVIYYFSHKYLVKAIKFKSGIKGEDRVLNELMKLPDSYSIFRNIHLPQTKWDIDYVVLGPKGLNVIEVKNIKGVIEYKDGELLHNGKLLENKSVVTQIRNQYWGLHNYLKDKLNKDIYISALLIFVQGQLEIGLNPYKDVAIIKYTNLVNYFKNISISTYNYSFGEVEKELHNLSVKKF